MTIPISISATFERIVNTIFEEINRAMAAGVGSSCALWCFFGQQKRDAARGTEPSYWGNGFM